MKENKGRYSLTRMAALFGFSRGAYYKWFSGAGKREARKEAESSLVTLIAKIVEEHKYRYGTPRIDEELRDTYKIAVNHKKVARLLKKYGLNAKSKRKFIPTTNSNHGLPVCANILNRNFHAKHPGIKWVSDITYLRTSSGWLYLTTVIDLFDRQVIGWAFSTGMSAEQTVIPAFLMACATRKPKTDLIFHSDRGVQYCSEAFREVLKKHCKDIRQSMSRKGNCWDNACAESFFKTLKRELEGLDGKQSATTVRALVFEYIAVYYNRKRRHSALAYLPPIRVSFSKVA
jgi:transposase InsO family protein